MNIFKNKFRVKKHRSWSLWDPSKEWFVQIKRWYSREWVFFEGDYETEDLAFWQAVLFSRGSHTHEKELKHRLEPE